MYEYKDAQFVPSGTESWVAWPVLLLMQIVEAVSSSAEKKLDGLSDRMLERLRVPDWCVTWPELRHEGDTAYYYRARVDTFLDRWTALASARPEPKKQRPPVECRLPWRNYRGVGGDHVVTAAAARGWELRPSEPDEAIRLWWSAASDPGAGTGRRGSGGRGTVLS